MYLLEETGMHEEQENGEVQIVGKRHRVLLRDRESKQMENMEK